MTNYEKKKGQARQQAIEWQLEFSNGNHYMSEYAEWGDHFRKLAKRYGLTKEFKENGII